MASIASSISSANQGTLAPELDAKESELRSLMRSMRKVLVAYSGGVDSSYLAYIAKQELGRDAVCILGVSPSVSERQLEEARKFALTHDLNILEIVTDELKDENYTSNPANRCYFCKSELYGKLRSTAKDLGIGHIVDGTNASDLKDVRPGRVAASENEVRSPLAEIGIEKSMIRKLSDIHGLDTWDKPSSPCLSSRIAYGVPVTIERLGQVERAEAVLRAMGLREFRVRVHGDLARIEISKDELANFLNGDAFDHVRASFKPLGFKYITFDLEGFRSGSMN